MPTINKNKKLTSDGSATVKSIESMLAELPGVTTEATSQSPYTFNVYFDGNKDTIIRITNVGTVSGYSSNAKLEICEKTGESYTTKRSYTFRMNIPDTNRKAVWLREYVSSESSKDRLITISTGMVGETGGDLFGAQGYAYDGCIVIGEDSLGNVVYGIGGSGIQQLYCPQTNSTVSMNNMAFNNQSTGSVNNHNEPIDSLADKAYMVKAVNLCHPDLPEMKNIYTAVFRPGSRLSGRAAQRYYISGSMWGTIGSDQLAYKCNYFDPMVKI